MKTLKSLSSKDLAKLKGKKLEYSEMRNAEIGTLFVGKVSNDIYEVIELKKIRNRNTGHITGIGGMGMHRYLGVQPNDKLVNAEEW